MDYKIEKLQDNKIKINLNLTAQEWEQELNAAYNKHKHQYSVPGFRAGKAPRARVEKEYGESVFFNDALSDGFYKYYMQILDKESDIEPVDAPSINVLDISDKGVELEAIIEIMPEINLKKYTGFGIKKEAVEVTEKDIENEIEKILEQQVRFVETDKAVENGDIANIDFSGSVDGVKFDGGTAEGYDLEIGSGNFIAGFEEQIVGLKAGEEKDVKVTFPTEYHSKDLAGKPAVFAIKVNAVKVKERPELTDELVDNATEYKTIEELKAGLKEKLTEKLEKDAKLQFESKILEAVLENTVVELPDSLVDHEVDHMISDFEMQLAYQGLNINDYLNYLGVNMDQFKAERRVDAVKNVTLRMAMQEIVKLENLEVTEEDKNEHLAELAKNAKISVDAYKQRLDDHAWSHINSDIIMSKVLKFLVSKN